VPTLIWEASRLQESFVHLSRLSTQIGAKFTHSPSQAFAQEHS
jgi:hypothetical protein